MARYGPNPVGHFIQRLMHEKGWKHEDLAERLGIDRSNITQWTQGLTMPSEHRLQKLADLADVDIEYLRLLRNSVILQRQGLEVVTKAGEILADDEKRLLDAWRGEDHAEIMNMLSARIGHKRRNTHAANNVSQVI